MLCGPFAIQSATGIDYRESVLRIRALREAQGKRVSLRGGTYTTELKAVLADRGWRMRRVFQGKRVRLKALASRITKGRWVFHQRKHFFGVSSGQELQRLARQHPTAIITAGYLCHRTSR